MRGLGASYWTIRENPQRGLPMARLGCVRKSQQAALLSLARAFNTSSRGLDNPRLVGTTKLSAGGTQPYLPELDGNVEYLWHSCGYRLVPRVSLRLTLGYSSETPAGGFNGKPCGRAEKSARSGEKDSAVEAKTSAVLEQNFGGFGAKHRGFWSKTSGVLEKKNARSISLFPKEPKQAP